MTATMIDVREYPEFASGHICGSRLVPVGSIAEQSALWSRSEPVMLVCKSGRRAEQARLQLVARGFTSVSVLDGGVDAWRSAGKPLIVQKKGPWSMERQVRATAGSLILFTMGMACFVSPRFFIGTALVGAGLVFAGVSDSCMMASALGHLPWNRPKESVA